MHFVNIGPLHVQLEWIFIGVSIFISVFILKFYLRRLGLDDKKFIEIVWNGIFIYILVWKFSLLIFNPNLVIQSPLSILYFTGGEKGLWLGFAVTFLYMLKNAKKLNVSILKMVNILIIFGINTFGIFHLFSIFTWENLHLHILCSSGAIIISIIIMKTHTTNIFKPNIIIMTLLVCMIGWAVYAQINKSTEQTEAVDVKLATSAEVGLKKGNIAPDFELTTLEGKPVKLSDFKGKKVILNFWATWCPPCKAEMPHMQNFYEEQKNDNGDVEILAVNLSDSEKNNQVVKQFVKEYELTFPILLDTEGVGDDYQAFTIPTSYVIDSNGIIKHKIVGPMSKEMMEKMVNSIN